MAVVTDPHATMRMALVRSLMPQQPPLHLDDDGVLRVGGTRVTLDTVVGAYQDGASPEQIVLGYDVLKLDEVYAVLSFYLRHRPAVEAYRAARREEAAAIRAENQERFPPSGVRERLLARRHAEMHGGMAGPRGPATAAGGWTPTTQCETLCGREESEWLPIP